MNASERKAMGELRSLLQSAPSTSTQRRVFVKKLAQLLDRFRTELLRDVVIDYVLQAMSSPPLDLINFSPTDRWLSDLVRGVDVPQLALVTTIELGPRAQSASLLAKVLRADGLKRLNHIRLRGWRLDAAYLDGLIDGASELKLTRLELEQCFCSSAWSEALVDWAGLDHVQALTMPAQSLTSASAVALASRPALKLRELSMYGQGCSASALAKLLEAPWIEGLTTFELDALNIRHSERPDDEHVQVIASCERLAALESLGLRSFSMHASGARALSYAFALEDLERLDLSSCDTLTDRGLSALFEGSALESLCELNLSDCGLTEVSVYDFLDLERLPMLRKIDLSYNEIVYEADPDGPYHEYRPMTPEMIRLELFGGRENLEVIYEQRGQCS